MTAAGFLKEAQKRSEVGPGIRNNSTSASIFPKCITFPLSLLPIALWDKKNKI